MKFQVGDKVLLLHSKEEGVVVDIIDSKMLLVEVDGVQFPVYQDQIDHPYLHRFQSKKQQAPKPKKYVEDIKPEKQVNTNRYQLGHGLWIILLPVFDKDVFDDDIIEYCKIYLLNQTLDTLNFEYQLFLGQSLDFELHNEIRPFQEFYLHDILFEKFNDGPRFVFDTALKTPEKHRVDHCEATLKIKNRQLFQRIENMRLKQEAVVSYLLWDQYPFKPEPVSLNLDALKSAGYTLHSDKKQVNNHLPPRTVVDLHIDKLTDQWSGLSSSEILDIQLKAFEKFYEAAIAHRQSTLIVIHGLGKGTLRDEIHAILRNKREVKSFVNQFHPSFGYGATEIYFAY